MKLFLGVFIALLLSAAHSCAQYSVSGQITDTLNQLPATHAPVLLLRAADSVLVNFTRGDNDGRFQLDAGKEGKFIILITYPSFADYTEVITITNKTPVNLGNINLVSRTQLLKEFVLTRQLAAIKIKGDTTEYVADSFKVKDNATVEDLLRRLPGMQVDENGKVTAQGETVQKILVDGEEFFSDDPAVVTKNLQSNVVDKVQVFDKKSEQAEFTGVDDGQKSKTINLLLKENKKKGYFGKVDAGAGTDGYYQNQAMINNFKGRQQLSVLGILSNTDQVGLGWADNNKYGTSNMTTEITDGGEVINYFSNNDNNDFQSWDGKYSGEGFPKIISGGVHYADKWNEDKEHLTGNYRYAMQDVDITGSTITQNILPDNTQNITRQQRYQSSRGERHSADAQYEWKIDTTATIKLTVNAGYKRTSTLSQYTTDIYYEPLGGAESLINTTNRRVASTAATQNINSDLLYRKKFNKKGRTLSIDVKENHKEGRGNGYLNSSSIFAGGYDSVIDQRKQNSTNTLAFSGKATYTEPLSKRVFAEVSYGLSVNNSSAVNNSYNKLPGSDTYATLDTLYSSNYTFNVLTNTGGANLRYMYKKVNFSLGCDVSDSRYKQTDLLRNDTTYKYDYLNLFPNASVKYKLGKQASLSLNYQGNTRQPTIDQVAPLHQNTDPLNIEVGDPVLKQEFRHTLSTNFNDYMIVSGRYIWCGASVTFINNAISTAQNTDPLTGIRTYEYVNVNGNYNGWGYAGYAFKVKKNQPEYKLWR